MERKLFTKNNSSVSIKESQLRSGFIMKTNRIKKTVLAVTLAASMAIPTATLSTAMTAQAASNVPFCADTDNNGAVNIQEDQIYVSRSYYEARSNTISTEITHEVNDLYLDDALFVKSKDNITLQPLARYVLSFIVSGDNLSESDLKGMKLTFVFLTKDNKKIMKIEPSKLEARGKDSYYVSYDFTAYGESVYFYSSYIENLNLNCSSASLTSTLDNDDYYLIEARPADGEKLFIRIKIDESISWNKMEEWAKRNCIYANSLSATTGVKLDTLYMDFDYSDCPYHAISNNKKINGNLDKYGYVAFNEYASQDVRDQIALGRNSITWVEMHEMAHSYACYTSSNFEKNYLFWNSNGTFDEYLTNARGITAIQNCDNLRNTEIVFETVGYSGKYNTMANDVYTHNLNDYKFEFASDLSYFPWEQLEEYFAATSDNDPDLIESKLVAKKINEFIGMDVPLSKNYLKFSNTIRKLMKLNNNGVYDESKFNRFMIEYFSKDLIKGLVKELKFDQEKV